MGVGWGRGDETAVTKGVIRAVLCSFLSQRPDPGRNPDFYSEMY